MLKGFYIVNMGRTKKDMIRLNKLKDVEKVITFDGKSALREDCKLIKGKYYEIDISCFLIKNEDGVPKWHRIDSGLIGYDYEQKRWDKIKRLRENDDYVEGIVDKTGKKGFFKLNPFTNVTLLPAMNTQITCGTPCLNAEIAEELGYFKDYKTGCYVDKTGFSANDIRGYKQKRVYKYDAKSIKYNADDKNTTFLRVIKEYNKFKTRQPLSPYTVEAAKLLGSYSFGIEYESSNGYIPMHILEKLGLVPLKDGSLRTPEGVEPYEFTTVPLSGEYGLETLKNQCRELTERCEFNNKCSLHIHIGSISKRKMEFVIALYKLAYKIQGEIFAMFPEYKKVPEKYVENYHKNYCQFLPDLNLDDFKFDNFKSVKEAEKTIKAAFDRIYWFASDQIIKETDADYNLNSFLHPKGNVEKWNYSSRYHWLNLHNYLFSRRETIEFRVSTPTFNHIKVSNWLFITAAIVNFAETFSNEILNNICEFNLDTIISCYENNFFKSFYKTDYSEKAAGYLREYINFRKKAMAADIAKGDPWGNSIEFKADSKFKFNSHGLDGLY